MNIVNEDAKVIRSFQDKFRYLLPTATIHAPGNFNISYKTAMHAFMSYMVTDNHHALLLRNLNAWDLERLRESDIVALDHSGWENRVEIMHQVTLQKFLSNEKFMNMLMIRDSEYESFIFENKNHDNFWGDCICGFREECYEEGKNHLGRILLSVREEIRSVLSHVPTVKEAFPKIYEIQQSREKRFKEHDNKIPVKS